MSGGETWMLQSGGASEFSYWMVEGVEDSRRRDRKR